MKTINKTLLVCFSGCLVLFFLSGCGESRAPDTGKKIRLKIEEKRLYKIPVDEHFTASAEHFQAVGSENSYFLCPDSKALFVLHLQTGKLEKMALFPSLPMPNGYTVDEKKKRMTVYAEDSTSVFTLSGRFLYSYQLEDKTGQGYFGAVNRQFLPIIKGGKQYVQFFANVPESYKNPEFFKHPVEAVWDPKTGKAELIPQAYPANFQQYCYSYNYLADRIELDHNRHGYTFPYNDSIFCINLKTGKKTAHFMGSRKRQAFKYLRYDELSKLHESAFDDVIAANPYYMLTKNFPLSGLYSRILITRDKPNSVVLTQHMLLFDREFTYIGETDPPFNPRILADSKKGLLSLFFDSAKRVITVYKLSWK